MSSITVRGAVHERDIGLLGSSRQPSRWTATLNNEEDRRDFSVIGEATRLVHERDSGPRSRSHGPRTGPAGANDHSHGGDLIFGLDNGVGLFAVFGLAQSGQVVLHGFRQ